MAARPWVTPKEVREYSEVASVQSRSDARLRVDISRAEQHVITYTHNDFSDVEPLPEPVKTAVLILAENYAHNAAIISRELKSETLDEYSYTAENSTIEVSDLDLGALLDGFVKPIAKSGITFRLRKL